MNPIDLAERGLLPDRIVRHGIRALIRRRLARERSGGVEVQWRNQQALLDELSGSPIAIETAAANAQHYEVPAEFFELVLGSHLKYSSALWQDGAATLDQAETAMLARTCEDAGLEDGQRILELGCGWGSLTLWMAGHYPESRITAVSNSHSQRRHIETRALELGLDNIEVLTADVNSLELDQRYDRVVSVEMFEHIRNYRELLGRIAGWMAPDGRLFVHIFCHRYLAYPFETQGAGNWMGRYFFSGGLMPAADTLLHFADDLAIERRRLYSGNHYARTARAWLDRLDANADGVHEVMASMHGEQAELWQQRWRMFFMSCEELFAFNGGNEWLVAHFRFRRR